MNRDLSICQHCEKCKQDYDYDPFLKGGYPEAYEKAGKEKYYECLLDPEHWSYTKAEWKEHKIPNNCELKLEYTVLEQTEFQQEYLWEPYDGE